MVLLVRFELTLYRLSTYFLFQLEYSKLMSVLFVSPLTLLVETQVILLPDIIW